MSDTYQTFLSQKFDVVAVIDFETFWDVDFTLKKLTNESYVRDPRFEVIGVSVKFGKDAETVWMEEGEFRAWAKRVDWKRVAVVCHHAQFDAFILSERYGIRPGMLLCTMSMARALGYQKVSLEDLAVKLGLPPKGKEVLNTKGKRRKDFTDEEWERYGEYCDRDVLITHLLLWIFLPGFPRAELWSIDTTIRMFTEPSFDGDLDALEKTLIEERKRKAALLSKVAESAGENAAEVLGSSDKFAALLKTFGVDPPTKVNKKGTARIRAFAKTDPGMQELLEHPDDEIRFLAEARLSVKSTIVETRTERLIGIAKRGRVPFYLKYCGAHTHRWSGGDKMNPQNFNRGGALRDAIIVPEGYVLVVADSGQIEARVTAWLARQTDLLDTFRRNDEQTRIYKEAFSEREKVLGREASKEEAKEIDKALAAIGIEEGDFYSDVGQNFFGKKLSKKETPSERQISKALALGLGFGMGWLKCAAELLKGMLGTPPVQFTEADAKRFGVDIRAFLHTYDGDRDEEKIRRIKEMPSRIDYRARVIHCAVANHFVQLYRKRYSRISGLWKYMGNVIGMMEADGDPNTVRRIYGPLKFRRHAVDKPSGLTLHYHGLRKSAKGDGYSYMGGKSGRERVRIYGALLVENEVQSIARDILAEQALRCRAQGYRNGTTTHDELVCVVPKAQGEECLDFMIRTMRTAPAWCADLPLNAEGGIAYRYGDAK